MRPKLPLLQKLSKASGQSPDELARSLSTWPHPEGEACWFGSRTIFHEGKPRTTVSLMIEYAMGRKADPSWRFVRTYCPNRGCRNPHHYSVQAVQKYDGSPKMQPPTGYFSAAARNEQRDKEVWIPDLPHGDAGPCLDREVEDPADFGDACDFIEDDESGARRGMTAEELHQVFSGYPVSLYERALAHVNRPRFWNSWGAG